MAFILIYIVTDGAINNDLMYVLEARSYALSPSELDVGIVVACAVISLLVPVTIFLNRMVFGPLSALVSASAAFSSV